MESLVEQLNNYSKHGIPQLSSAEEDREDSEFIFSYLMNLSYKPGAIGNILTWTT